MSSGQKIKTILTMAFAYVGVLVGAGFASGQEILQYFVSHGTWGFVGAIFALIFFSLTGLILLQLGAKYDANSHEDVLKRISPKPVHKFLDYSIIFTLALMGVVMIAGAGSNLNQQFGLPIWMGSVVCAILIVVVSFLDTSKVIEIISLVTPFLLVFVLGAAIYAIFNAQGEYTELAKVAEGAQSATPHWLLSAFNYMAMNLMMGASMAMVMGGDEDKPKLAGFGGLLGGALIGIMVMLVTVALTLTINSVIDDPMPLLGLVNLVHPVAGTVMSIVLYLMIFNTGLSMFYSFTSRIIPDGDDRKFSIVLIISVVVAFIISFVGFKTLLSIFYPIIGYVGFILIALLIVTWINNVRRRLKIARDESNDLSFKDTKV